MIVYPAIDVRHGRVVRLLSGLRAKVNLIPWNPGAPVRWVKIE